MENKIISNALADLRETIYSEIEKAIRANGGRLDVCVELPCVSDEEVAGAPAVVTGLFLNTDEKVFVNYVCNPSDDFMLLSVDEMLKIVDAL